MNLYSILQHAHSGLRWLVLAFLLAAIATAYSKWKAGDGYTVKPPKPILFGLIFTHVQFIIGLVLYFQSPKVRFEGNVMGESLTRFYTVEHITMMLIAIVLITIGYSRAKRQAPDNKGYKTVFWFYLVGLLLILLSIPWPFREALGGSWF